MKKYLILAAVFMSSLFVNAADIEVGTKVVDLQCSIIGRSAIEKYNLKVVTLVRARSQENTLVASRLIINRIYPLGSEVISIPKTYLGKYKFEDVVTEFVSDDGLVNFTVYADELGQTILQVGRSMTRYNCNQEH